MTASEDASANNENTVGFRMVRFPVRAANLESHFSA
jgi:hypothetical protein